MQATKICHLARCGSLSIYLLEFSLFYPIVERQRGRSSLETLRGWGDLEEHREEERNFGSGGKDVPSVIVLWTLKLDIFFWKLGDQLKYPYATIASQHFQLNLSFVFQFSWFFVFVLLYFFLKEGNEVHVLPLNFWCSWIYDGQHGFT